MSTPVDMGNSPSIWSSQKSKEEWAAACKAMGEAWNGATGLAVDLCRPGGIKALSEGALPSRDMFEAFGKWWDNREGLGTKVCLKDYETSASSGTQAALPVQKGIIK